MSLDRTLSAIVGLCLLGVGVLVLASPAAESLIPTGDLVGRLGNDYLLVAAVAAAVLAVTPFVLLLRSLTGVAEATPPSVEGTEPHSPGAAIDATLTSLPPLRVTDGNRRIHRRLRRSAIDSIAERRRCSREAARNSVVRGEWTADPVAAAFLAPEALDPPSIERRLLDAVRGNHWFRRRVETTVAALETQEAEA